MAMAVDGCVIFAGGLMGNVLKKYIKINNMAVLAVVIMIISLVGVVSNLLTVSENSLQSENLLVVVFCLMIGTLIGEKIGLEEKISKSSDTGNKSLTGAVLFGCIFFGAGGLQITGPIACVAQNDSSILLMKSLIDFPFAIIFGAIYGKGISFSGIVVLLIQLLLGFVVFAARSFFTDDVVSQLSAMGYIILFLSGYNLIFDDRKISTVNMLPAIAVVIVYWIVRYIAG